MLLVLGYLDVLRPREKCLCCINQSPHPPFDEPMRLVSFTSMKTVYKLLFCFFPHEMQIELISTTTLQLRTRSLLVEYSRVSADSEPEKLMDTEVASKVAGSDSVGS